MEVHGITFTHDDPDWDYCTWECTCGQFSRVNDIDMSYMLASMHIDSAKASKRKLTQANKE